MFAWFDRIGVALVIAPYAASLLLGLLGIMASFAVVTGLILHAGIVPIPLRTVGNIAELASTAVFGMAVGAVMLGVGIWGAKREIRRLRLK